MKPICNISPMCKHPICAIRVDNIHDYPLGPAEAESACWRGMLGAGENWTTDHEH